MAFPIVRSVAGAAGSTTTIPYPADVQAGDTLLWFTGLTASVPTEPGWTLVATHTGFSLYTYVFSKVADGTEGGTTFTASTLRMRNVVVAVAAGSSPEIDGTCLASNTSSDTPNAPSHTPAGGARDYLWLAYGGSSTNFSTPIGAPTNYTLAYSSTGLGLAYRELNAASDDPGAFTDNDASNTTNWNAATVAIFGTTAVANPLFFGCNF